MNANKMRVLAESNEKEPSFEEVVLTITASIQNRAKDGYFNHTNIINPTLVSPVVRYFQNRGFKVQTSSIDPTLVQFWW